MNYKNIFILITTIAAVFFACTPDDDEVSIPPPRDRGEQQITDDELLLEYLQTHYYNKSFFSDPTIDYSKEDIIISESPLDEDGNPNELLWNDVTLGMTSYLEQDYVYYVLDLNPGLGGPQPNFTDNISINYTGLLQDGDIFDSSVNPAVFNLLGVVPGWKDVLQDFKTAESIFENSDGTVTYSNYGFGVMFLPSGLGYFNQGQVGIPSYSNLIFKFELYDSSPVDNDSDGVLTHIEDVNGNENIADDDTDGDGVPNFLDVDDDGDGVLTIYEDLNNDGDPTNDDSDGDGIPNYLDADSTESNQTDT
ncbi:FKBP-type peptidyl-prolyl cis-trans isomerase [Psychroserpens sp. Hel_I_66]|uniref:FKBP-type peptidyl-prolyl cis-trans isomerase n=1 Tax=Psychroserpens sp. Hel_I_66 TaxID=1250004 RepID=UPI00068D6289|nr:FKBP-type peptidyl-prolyl cis-trans isomerase [Psychroserpens sp. Hel_I_66]